MLNTDDDTYLTVSDISEGIFKDRGSKFIAYAHPVVNAEQVKPIVDNYKKQHSNARHHCYAYRIGINNDNYRQNDDGEPSGTAGKPIFGQIESFNLTDILVVVVRYFGGTLLGTGGLINAYKTAAQEALLQASIIKKQITEQFCITFNYPETSNVERIIKSSDAKVVHQQFGANCKQIVAIKKSMANTFYQQIASIHQVQVEPV